MPRFGWSPEVISNRASVPASAHTQAPRTVRTRSSSPRGPRVVCEGPVALNGPTWRLGPAAICFSGPETGKRKWITRKADGKLMFLFVNLGWSWHEKLTLLVTHFSLINHFSLPISGPLTAHLRLHLGGYPGECTFDLAGEATGPQGRACALESACFLHDSRKPMHN